jgi:mannose-6-phosphate isomerase-like protein (cupin superfamily)
MLIQPLLANQAGLTPAPKVVQLDPAATEYVPVLTGPPETITMRSGSVVLLPSKDVGKHSTGNNEEALVVFAGSGEMRMSSGVTLKLKPYVVAYCPPDTEHNVFNTGSEPLRYVYVVAKAR